MALDFLKKPRILQVPGHGVRTLGSHVASDQGHVHKAVAHMMSWAKVTRQISEPGFLEQDLLSSLKRVLHVARKSGGPALERRWSGTFDEDSASLHHGRGQASGPTGGPLARRRA